jgi:hypothetical protein
MTAELLVGQGLRGNTHRTYTSAQRRYITYCLEFNLLSMPASDEVLLQYVAYLFQKGLKGSTIKVYLSAVRSLHVFNNLTPSVHSEKLLLALKGATRMSAPPRPKAPHNIQGTLRNPTVPGRSSRSITINDRHECRVLRLFPGRRALPTGQGEFLGQEPPDL